MRRNITFAAIICGLVGCAFGLMAAWKIENMFTENSFSIGWGKAHTGFWWDHALLLSFGSGSVAFVLEFIAVVLENGRHRSEDTTRRI
jgi:hypothetical protein